MSTRCQVKWASLMAQMIKNLPAMHETWVWSLGGEDSLEECMATHSSILARRIPMDGEAWWATDQVVRRVGHDWMTKHNGTHQDQGYPGIKDKHNSSLKFIVHQLKGMTSHSLPTINYSCFKLLFNQFSPKRKRTDVNKRKQKLMKTRSRKVREIFVPATSNLSSFYF